MWQLFQNLKSCKCSLFLQIQNWMFKKSLNFWLRCFCVKLASEICCICTYLLKHHFWATQIERAIHLRKRNWSRNPHPWTLSFHSSAAGLAYPSFNLPPPCPPLLQNKLIKRRRALVCAFEFSRCIIPRRRPLLKHKEFAEETPRRRSYVTRPAEEAASAAAAAAAGWRMRCVGRPSSAPAAGSLAGLVKEKRAAGTLCMILSLSRAEDSASGGPAHSQAPR